MAKQNQVQSRNEWIISKYKKITYDKQELINTYIYLLLRRLQRLFKYKGLPDSIPQKDLEIILQVGGYATFKKVNGELYAFYSGLGGRLNAYYKPTVSVVANPYLNYSATLEIDKDCVVVLNDSLYQGLMSLISKYAELLAECDISLRIACVNSRIPSIILCDNDETYESAKDFIKDITDGNDNGITLTSKFFEGLKTFNYNERSENIKDLIELRQYLFGSMFNELGLEAQFNMKREAINSSESTLNQDILKPLIDDMLEQRRIGLEKVNKMYGTNITVEFDSSWKENEEQRELEKEILEKEAGGDDNDNKGKEETEGND